MGKTGLEEPSLVLCGGVASSTPEAFAAEPGFCGFSAMEPECSSCTAEIGSADCDVDKSVVDKSFVDRSFVDKSFVDKSFVDKSFVDKSFLEECSCGEESWDSFNVEWA